MPLKRGRGATLTHDYKRNGTATLFAALNAANGEVFGLCLERHRLEEWLKFLRLIDQTIPVDRQLHLICNNYARTSTPKCSAGSSGTRAFICTSLPPAPRG